MARRQVSKGRPFGVDAERLGAISALSGDFKNWKPGPEVVRNVVAVPTDLPQFNALTGVGGCPSERVIVVHGPSNEGKSSLALGLGASYLSHGHIYGLVEAEHTTPQDWARQMMQRTFDQPGFFALPDTGTYEKVVNGIREFCTGIANKRAQGKLPADLKTLIVLDSLTKLLPERLLKNLLTTGSADGNEEKPKKGKFGKKKPKGVDGYDGNAGRYVAQLNTAWMRELGSLMYTTDSTIVLICREYAGATQANVRTQREDESFTVSGGAGPNFEAALRLRVGRKYIPHPEKDRHDLFAGERHSMDLFKTKVAGRVEKVPRRYFHTSNGVVVPAGFWRERDVLELGLSTGVIELRGAWYNWGEQRLGQGEAKALDWLHRERDGMMEIEKRAVESAIETQKVA